MSEIPTSNSQELQQHSDESSFQWDQSSQLYYHASSGFYYEPNAGWYYSSRDGLCYKFEDGNYVLLESRKDDGVEGYQCGGVGYDEMGQDGTEMPVGKENVDGMTRCTGTMPDESALDEQSRTEGTILQEPENQPPISDWLEETLINLYLSGYSNLEKSAADTSTQSIGDDGDHITVPVADAAHDCIQGQEAKHFHDGRSSLADADVNVLPEDASWDEENWRAQYGQVTKSNDDPPLDSSVVDLWDWALVAGSKKDGKGQVTRLVGQLVKPSSKLHPAIASCRLLKTAPVCEVNFDLVRVTTGQVYRLRTPSAKYLASLLAYDSSNPTKDWGFPELKIDLKNHSLSKFEGSSRQETSDGSPVINETSVLPDQFSTSKKHKADTYRDRAAERRKRHGGYGVGPGHKSSVVGEPSSSPAITTEEAQAEAQNMSFGVGSYAQKILENMGWKEGEALGKTTKGIVEPIEAVGNIGSAGLGWPQSKRPR